ncbi:uncharacterized protein LOC121727417 [Aricia agestis]|uniref:uncharacterized protein LOC121727417 n=1 Tax=Aricia agestis TaxID=91739 RepID=UPI001C2026D0|nr:uncharacterized protein LOC121727417 [Aricia agestis]
MKNVILHFEVMKVSFITIVVLISCCNGENTTDQYLSTLMADLWLEGADVVRIIWRDCSKKLVDVKDVIDHKEYFPKFVRCMKRKTLRALDRALSPDVVPISDGVNLVRYELVDNTGNIMPENETSPWSEKELEEGDWRTLALQRMAKILRTHVIKFDFGNERTVDKAEYRGRRRHQMLTMMMFGVVSIGMVLVPMGFQFLAVLGGKALLLAKMALILASIQGLKKVDSYDGFHDRGKIATSPLNYGFYHSFPPYDHFERRSRDGWANSGVAASSPPTYGPWSDASGIKVDRVHIAEDDVKIMKRDTSAQEAREFPIYPVPLGLQSSYPVYSAIDTPLADFVTRPVEVQGSLYPASSAIDTPLVDLTTRPGEVQADYSLDLPYHGFRFQSPSSVVPP